MQVSFVLSGPEERPPTIGGRNEQAFPHREHRLISIKLAMSAAPTQKSLSISSGTAGGKKETRQVKKVSGTGGFSPGLLVSDPGRTPTTYSHLNGWTAGPRREEQL
jgi:hypothetical protein